MHDARRPHARALVLFLLLNTLGVTAIFIRHEWHLQDVLMATPAPAARLFFLCYIAGVMSILSGLLLLPGALQSRLRGRQDERARRHRTWNVTAVAAVVVMSLLIIFFAVDTRIYENTGVHLYSDVTLEALANKEAATVIALSAATLRSIFIFSLAVIVFEIAMYAVLAWGARKHATGHVARAGHHLRWVLLALIAACVGGGLLLHTAAGQAPLVYLDALPLYRGLHTDLTLEPVPGAVGYPPSDAGAAPSRMLRRPNIVFILAESMRHDYVNATLTPTLRAFSESHANLRSERHYSAGHTSDHGVFGLLYGLNGYCFHPFRAAGVPSHPLQLLKENGYKLVGACSSPLKQWNDSAFMVDGFDRYEEFLEAPTHLADRVLVDWVGNYLRGRDPDAPPFFMFLFLNATHHNYTYPPAFEIDKPVLPVDYDHFLSDAKLRSSRTEIVNRYRNAVRYIDALTGELIELFAPMRDSGSLVLLFTGDHAEEFWEHGFLGHGATSFIDERIRVPLILHLSGRAGAAPAMTQVARSSHVDVWPTIFGHVGLDPPVPPEFYSDGVDLRESHDEGRAIFVGGTGFPWNNRVACLIDDTYKHWLELCEGEGLCLRAWRTTTLDDVEVQRPASTLPPHADALRRNFDRFLRYR